MIAIDRGRGPTPGLAFRLAKFELNTRVRRMRIRLGLLQLQDLTPDTHRAPDSQLAKDAFELAARLSPPMLLNHTLRTYHFGAIIAARDGLRFDRELVYVASLLHDLGLTAEHENDPGSFKWVGARLARDFGVERGMESVRADLLHDAVALHSSVGLASTREPEVAIVHYGAGADLLGARVDEIPKGDLDRLLAEWPRAGFKHDFPGCLERQVELKPNSHIAGAMGLGLATLARSAPFDD